MPGSPISRQIEELFRFVEPLMGFFLETQARVEAAGAEACDFRAGDPHEMALEAYGDAIRRATVPRDTSWYAYTMSDPEAQAVVAKALNERLGVPFQPEDITMTNAAMAGIGVTIRAIADPGDQIMIVVPPHFLYEPLMRASGAEPVRVAMDSQTFDLDVDAIAAAITPQTRGILVNSPHNPSGKIYPPETLERLASVLAEASERNGRTIYLLSDEAYQRIVFDGRTFRSPVEFYPASFLIYTYGKTLLVPGQRLGYVAVNPLMQEKERVLAALTTAQLAYGWAFPNALLQHALADLEALTIDIPHLQRKRDTMVDGLRDLGYDLHVPEATFYLMVRSPIEDDVDFMRRLADRNVFVLPGSMLEQPGYFRISLTASDDMIKRAWKGFASALGGTE